MNIASMDNSLRDRVWAIASHVEWTEDDWRDFYQSLTAAFARIAARHAMTKIKGTQFPQAERAGEMVEEETRKSTKRIARLESILREALEASNCDGDLCNYKWHQDAREMLEPKI